MCNLLFIGHSRVRHSLEVLRLNLVDGCSDISACLLCSSSMIYCLSCQLFGVGNIQLSFTAKFDPNSLPYGSVRPFRFVAFRGGGERVVLSKLELFRALDFYFLYFVSCFLFLVSFTLICRLVGMFPTFEIRQI